MGNPYSSVSVSGYNSNPPADDGSQVEANRVKWSTIKTKLPDPLKTAIESINTALVAAFPKVIGGGGITSTGISYTVISSDQGKLVRATVAGVTITTPDATSVDDPFVFGVLNNSDGDITLDGSGSQTVDGDATVTIPTGAGLIVFTDGTNWYTSGQSFARTQVSPQGYLTLIAEASQATSPVPITDQAAATAVYYRPDIGNLIPIPDGTNFSVRTFAELTLTLNSNHVANGIYDVFAFDDSGVIRLGTGPVWNTVTAGSGARGSGAGTTELTRLQGLLVNNVAMTARNGASTYSVSAKCAIYLGTIIIDGTQGQCTCHVTYGQSRNWGVWNAFNRKPIILKAGDSTANWQYTTSAYRASNNASANSIRVLHGLPGTAFDVRNDLNFSGNNSTTAKAGIGWNSTSAASGKEGKFGQRNNDYANVVARFVQNAAVIGSNVITSLEYGSGGSTCTWYGTEAETLLSVRYMA